jgi:hypothetical protein
MIALLPWQPISHISGRIPTFILPHFCSKLVHRYGYINENHSSKANFKQAFMQLNNAQ